MKKDQEIYQKTCPNCKKEFKTKRKRKIYCSQTCQMKAWMDDHPRTKKNEI
jgi:endogenous inhibitor of DNA gyrase (YacG/DUF329 family)